MIVWSKDHSEKGDWRQQRLPTVAVGKVREKAQTKAEHRKWRGTLRTQNGQDLGAPFSQGSGKDGDEREGKAQIDLPGFWFGRLGTY